MRVRRRSWAVVVSAVVVVGLLTPSPIARADEEPTLEQCAQWIQDGVPVPADCIPLLENPAGPPASPDEPAAGGRLTPGELCELYPTDEGLAFSSTTDEDGVRICNGQRGTLADPDQAGTFLYLDLYAFSDEERFREGLLSAGIGDTWTPVDGLGDVAFRFFNVEAFFYVARGRYGMYGWAAVEQEGALRTLMAEIDAKLVALLEEERAAVDREAESEDGDSTATPPAEDVDVGLIAAGVMFGGGEFDSAGLAELERRTGGCGPRDIHREATREAAVSEGKAAQDIDNELRELYGDPLPAPCKQAAQSALNALREFAGRDLASFDNTNEWFDWLSEDDKGVVGVLWGASWLAALKDEDGESLFPTVAETMPVSTYLARDGLLGDERSRSSLANFLDIATGLDISVWDPKK